jgi:hypothetical protein
MSWVSGTVRLCRTLVLLASIAAVAWPRVALAQPPAPIPTRAEQAKAEYDRGLKHYNLADYEPAITAFKRAYELSGKPELLFNIAQAYRLKGDCKQAVLVYRSFLREATGHPRRREAESGIERCGAPTNGSEATPATAPPPVSSIVPPPTSAPEPNAPKPPATSPGARPPASSPPPASSLPPTSAASSVAPPPVEAPPLPLLPGPAAPDATLQASTPAAPSPPGRLKKIAGLTVGGVGAAMFVGGMLAGIKAKSSEKDVDDAFKAGGTWSPELGDKEKDGKSAARTANVLFGLGLAAMAGGGALYYFGVKQARAEGATTSVGLSPTGLWLSGRF